LLVELGGRLHARTRTADGYRMYCVPGPLPRPGLVRGDGPAGGIEVEIWDVPQQGIGILLTTIDAPLSLGQVVLDDGGVVAGFVADPTGLGADDDITSFGGWRAYLAGRSQG
jgi:allophanate hydrolase